MAFFPVFDPQFGILIFLGLMLLVALTNLFSLRRIEDFHEPVRFPLISVLVPARNEAHNIEACLSSLLSQNYEPYEVLVLDDESEDGTDKILARLRLSHPILKTIKGSPLPEGWVGKPWACHQLAKAARGELLLFTDADTRHHPMALKNAAAAMERLKLSFLSGMPRQDLGTWGERLSIPMLSFVLFTLLPLPLARWRRWPGLSFAVGQFMVFRREAYERIGGHAAVKETSVEDIAFARMVKRRRLAWDFMDLTERVRCRMYHGLGELFNGISKNLLAVFKGNLLVFGFAWLWLLYVMAQPVVVLTAALAGRPLEGYPLALSLAAVGLTVALWLLNNRRFRLPLSQALLYPATTALYTAMVLWSAWRGTFGRPAVWKGRPLPRPGGQTPGNGVPHSWVNGTELPRNRRA